MTVTIDLAPRPIFFMVGLMSFLPISWAIRALFEEFRIRGMRVTRVALLGSGRVALCGVVEEAWNSLISPFGQEKCVWYKSVGRIARGRLPRVAFREANAAPFILNDDSGRVLVLARRAKWDPATGGPAKLAGEGQAVESGWVPPASRQEPMGASSMPCLESYRDPDLEGLDWFGVEQTFRVGEVVTVVGQAVAYEPAILESMDFCPDGGESLGISSPFVIGSLPRAGLSVLAGRPREVARRIRFVFLLGFGGLAALTVSALVFVLGR